MDRKLASIQKIVSIDPIPDADAIEKATVLGWECVVAKKENFKVNDLVVYIEVDSIVPPKPEFEFLRDRKFRIKTIKLRKTLSQGLIMPLSILSSKNYNEGDDITEVLGIIKYDPQGDKERSENERKLALSKNRITRYFSRYSWFRNMFSFLQPKKQGFPKFIKKTDEDRIQLFPHICENEADTTFQVTEKIDGQSLTAFLVKKPKRFWQKQNYEFGVCSRNLLLKKPNDSSWWTVAKKYDLENVLKKLIGDKDFVALQGEVLGEGIQGNKYKITGYDLYIFNLIYPDGLVNSVDARNILKDYGLKFVPILDTNFKLKPTISENVDYAKGKSVLLDILREGVVLRCYDKSLSFKIINPEFLLKFDE
jgi:hypothetical protein